MSETGIAALGVEGHDAAHRGDNVAATLASMVASAIHGSDCAGLNDDGGAATYRAIR